MSENCNIFIKTALDSAQSYADKNSTCCKVKVGSCIIPRLGEQPLENLLTIYGCNHGIYKCNANVCRRVELYGENSKEHRLPSDCDAIHSEVDAICKAARQGVQLQGASIFVTRYPCEACARAIAASGIKNVYYGRKQYPSDYTTEILQDSGVNIYRVEDWDREDTTV